jgi:hypothetical protein
MVIVPDAFMASAPQGMLANSLNPQTRHFNLAETRHLNFGLTSKPVLNYIMSNAVSALSSDFIQLESLRESGRRLIVQTLLCALPVIKDLDVFRDFLLSLMAGHELAMIDKLIFQRTPE